MQDDELHYSIAGLETGEYKFFVYFGMGPNQAELLKHGMTISRRPLSGGSWYFAQKDLSEPGVHRVDALDLRERWIDLDLYLVDENDEPITTMMKITVTTDAGASFDWSSSSSIGMQRIRAVAKSVDVFVSVPGFRSQTVRGLTGNRQIVMQDGIPLKLVPARAFPELEAGDSVEVRISILRSADGEQSSESQPKQRLEADGVDFEVSRAGQWSIDWYLVREVDGREQRRRVNRSGQGGTIEVLAVDSGSDEGQVFQVEPPDAKDFERAARRFK